MELHNSVISYIKHINTYPSPSPRFPKIGRIYIFEYLFNYGKDFNNLNNREEIKFSDFVPATFVWNIDIRAKRFSGFNLHSVPIFRRTKWIELLRNYAGENTDKEKNFLPLKRLFKDSPFGMKQYSMNKVRKFREIPENNWIDLLKYDANTTMGATSNEIVAKYLSFIK